MNKLFSLILLFAMTSLMSSIASAEVWPVEHEWDNTWENHYRDWVRTSWKDDIFMDPSKPIYYEFENDCADAVYMMRLIFSFENRLPFAINNRDKAGKLISNSMSTWDNLAPPQRVRQFMNYVADMTSSESLSNDTYPIALADIKPGDVYVAPGVHSYQIVEVTDAGIAEVMASTTPKQARYLLRTPSFPFYVPEDKRLRDGYRRFKEPQNIMQPANQQPGYSEEQFQLAADLGGDYVAFTDIISKKLGRRTETADEKTQRLLLALCMYANDRSVYVYDALWYLQKIRNGGRHCMNAKEYEDHSTPGRDKRLKMFFDSIRRHLDRVGRFDPRSQPARWAKAVFSNDQPPPQEMQNLNNFCEVQMTLVGEGERDYKMTLRELRQNVDAGTLSSDPHAPLEYRWGIVKQPFVSGCPVY
jgi:sugar phosphate isomerase/epimerase